jgi:hypothetical protein
VNQLSAFIATAALAFAAGGVSAEAANPSLGQSGHMLKMPASMLQGHQPVSGANSPVGLWHTVNKTPDGQFFLEAYTTWNGDGTFDELANRPPATGSISRGVWTQEGNTVTLPTAVAWLYDTNNTFTGTLKLSESYTLKDHGNKLVGTFDAKFYDTQGKLLQEVNGSSKADRLN